MTKNNSTNITHENTKRMPKHFEMVFIAILIGLICFLTISGLGFIPIGPFRLTFLTLPVAIGSVILGPLAGLILGTAFGIASFITCFGIDPLGTFLLGVNPFYTFLFCVVPRMLCGVIPALIYKKTSKYDKSKILSSSICCMLTALLNTVLFLSVLWLLFGNDFINNSDLISLLGGMKVENMAILFTAFAGTNAIIEAGVGLVLGCAICKALLTMVKKLN